MRDEKTPYELLQEQLGLATEIEERLDAGDWTAPDADEPVEALRWHVKELSATVKSAVRKRFDHRSARDLVRDLKAGTLSAADSAALWKVLHEERVATVAVRMARSDRLVQLAEFDLLANPAMVDPFGGPKLCRLMAEAMRAPVDGADDLRIRTVDEMAARLQERHIALDSATAFALYGRARRDQSRYDRAAHSRIGHHATTPLVLAGNPMDEVQRGRYRRDFSWAIPSKAALAAIHEVGASIQVGAGNGYWAQLAIERGTDVLAFDFDPEPVDLTTPGTRHVRSWGQVAKARASVSAGFPDRALLLIWPRVDDPMAFEALTAFWAAGGETLIYIGEPRGGRCATPAFFFLLERAWEIAWTVEIPQWAGACDELAVYRRR